jgi:hypothetical protein
MKTWRKPKEFVCPICEKDFNKERKMYQHMKDKHSDIHYVWIKRTVEPVEPINEQQFIFFDETSSFNKEEWDKLKEHNNFIFSNAYKGKLKITGESK